MPKTDDQNKVKGKYNNCFTTLETDKDIVNERAELEIKGIKVKKSEVIVLMAEKAFEIKKLIESKEYDGSELLQKIEQIIQSD